MKLNPDLHQLLILSKDYAEYRNLIERAKLENLSIVATDHLEEAIKSIGECDLLFGEPGLLRQIIHQMPRLRWCQSTWAGVEPLLVPGMRKDYILTNARDVYGDLMSEYVFGYLLFFERRIQLRYQAQLKREWDERPNGTVKGKLIGLMGVGSIGSHLASTAHHFKMYVRGFTRSSEACPEVDQYFHGDSISEFVKDLDYLVCCLPGTPETRNLINAKLLSDLPNTAWLINIGRGNTVNEPALIQALNNGSLAGAVLDVFIDEPLPNNHPLWHTPNTNITSHTAAKNYLPDIAAIFIQNYKLFIEGKPVQHQVSFERNY